jgi:transposase
MWSAWMIAAPLCCVRSGRVGKIEARLANLPPCLIGMEACVGAHHLSRKLKALGHDARLMPAKYVRPYSKGQKNDFRDAEAIAEAVQRPTMKFVATKTVEQLDLQALHRVRERLVSQRTGNTTMSRVTLTIHRFNMAPSTTRRVCSRARPISPSCSCFGLFLFRPELTFRLQAYQGRCP